MTQVRGGGPSGPGLGMTTLPSPWGCVWVGWPGHLPRVLGAGRPGLQEEPVGRLQNQPSAPVAMARLGDTLREARVFGG
jgi:hypothetical protein